MNWNEPSTRDFIQNLMEGGATLGQAQKFILEEVARALSPEYKAQLRREEIHRNKVRESLERREAKKAHRRERRKMSFDEWMREVDRAVENRVGLSCYDLPDWNYRDAFEDGMSPGKAARKVIKSEGY